MNILLLVVLLVVGVQSDYDRPHHKNFRDMLHEIQKSDEYEHMPDNEQILLSELILAAEDGPDALNHFIHREGLSTIFDFISDLKEEHASHFEYYLANHLTQNTKRDLASYLGDLHAMHKIADHLPRSDLDELQHLIKAAQANSLTQYIENQGYGPIFAILSHLEEDHNDDLLKLITAQLDKEAKMAN